MIFVNLNRQYLQQIAMHPVPEYENMNNDRSFNMLSELNDGYSRSRFPLGFFKQESMYIRGLSAPQEQSRDYGVASLGFQEISQGLHGNNSVNFFNQPKMLSEGVPKPVQQHQKQKIREELATLDKSHRKGLKFLAWVLNRLLRMKKFYSTDVIDECVQCVLAREGQHGDYQKQLQNVKRRIYDAINVMSAVGLITRNKSSEMYILESNNKVSKSSFMLMRQSEGRSEATHKYIEQIELAEKRVEIKRQHLQQISRRNQILKHIIMRNQRNNAKPNFEGIGKILNSIIRFPYFILTSEQHTLEIQCKKSRQQIKAKYQSGDLMMLTQYQSLDYLMPSTKPIILKDGFVGDLVSTALNQNKNFPPQIIPQRILEKNWELREKKEEKELIKQN